MEYLERWLSLWLRMECKTDGRRVYDKLVKKYSERHRAYHDFSHLEQCLDEFELAGDYLALPDEVEMAIWFHDSIYNPLSSRNEEASSKWAAEELSEGGADRDRIETVTRFIVSTKHHSSPADEDTKYLIDIDLAILGSAPEVYREYEKKIRQEYRWVPGFLFRRKRVGILSSFLQRDSIYYTDLFGSRYESQARINLKLALERMG